MPKVIPNVIYHYTSLETLQSIVQNKTIRLSDITKSNDSKEIALIGKYINDVYEAAYNAEKAKLFRNNYPWDEWRKRIDSGKEIWFEKDYNDYSYYVCCFSTEKDLLSQWRGYADDGRGVAIGFDSLAIRNLIEGGTDMSLKRVEYSRRSQRGIVRKRADMLIHDLKKLAMVSRGCNSVKCEDDIVNLFDDSFRDLFRQSISMKSSFFKEEKEIRLCYMVDNSKVINGVPIREEMAVSESTGKCHKNQSVERINDYAVLNPFTFVVKDNRITSYVDLGFRDYIEKESEPLIREIWLGPKCGASQYEMQRLLRQQGMGEVTVTKSEGTYR